MTKNSIEYDYTDAAHKHAVTSLGTGENYTYDTNGNMDCRSEGGVTYKQTYDVENRLTTVSKMSGGCAGTILETTSFMYDGDGNLVKKTDPNGSKTLYVGGVYEVDKSSGGAVTATRNYYPAAGAMRVNNTIYYIRKDHLGSASAVTDASGTILGEQLYYPFGQTRYATGSMYTDRLYTGQREISSLGIYYYNARFYSPYINHFISADTIVPNPADPQSWNRYSYVNNNPLRYTDPTGHMLDDGCDTEGCNLTSQQKAIDAQKQAKHEAEAARRKCEKGNKAYCSGWPNSKKVKRFLDPRPFLSDAWDGLTNPMSGVGFGYFVPSICQASGQSCSELTEKLVDFGSDVVIGFTTFVSNVNMVPDTGPTPTPYMISPTPATPEPTWTPLFTPTSTVPVTPTITMTPTLTVTPSATLLPPVWTSTPILTPAYRLP